jgi:putative selenate reductase
MALAILGAWEPLRRCWVPGAHLFDMSLGYDLAGSHRPWRVHLRLLDARSSTGSAVLPEPFAAWRERTIPSRIVTSVTLSTFHGCPPDEIEAIARHLMTEYGLDVVIKLNPTLLGIDAVSGILRRLGHDEVVLDPDAFAADLQYERAIEMVHSLHDFAAAQRRTVGIKLTNTLVVRNHLGRLPGDTMYLSGPPLHVIAVTLLDRLVGDLDGMLGIGPEPGPVPVSFSG